MSSVNWESVAAVLLERERRPAMLLDTDARVLLHNTPLQHLLPAGTPTRRVLVADDWVRREARKDFEAAWAKALSGARVRLAVPFQPAVLDVEPVFELTALEVHGEPRGVLAVMVDVQAGSLALPLHPPSGLLYEVQVDAHGEPGTLLRAASERGQVKFEPGAPCYQVIARSDAVCVDCPLRGLELAHGATQVRLRAEHPFAAELLTARRTRPGVATMSVVPVPQEVYTALVDCRVEALASRAGLSPRERRVLELLLLGRTLEDISHAEGVSVRTAKYHQANLLRKVGAESRMDLCRLFS